MPVKISYCSSSQKCLKVTYLGHTAVNNKVSAVDEAALITGQEYNGMCLLNGLTETTSGEVNLTALTLGLVIAQPILEKRSATRKLAWFVMFNE